MKISVVIVSYNVKFYLEQCLHSVLKATAGMEKEIFVFDNHSKDESVEYLKLRFPTVNFISSLHNIGFAKGNNYTINKTKGEYILLLNPDTFVGENVLREALDFMDAHKDAGGVGVEMHAADGMFAPESRRAIPSVLVSFLKMIGKDSRYYMRYLPKDETCQIQIVSGAFCLLRREALAKTGLFDTSYFMYGEDIDLSYRLLKNGYQNWYLPLKILHYKGESTRKTSFRYVHIFYKAMLIFFRKYYGHRSFLYTWPISIAIVFKAVIAFISLKCHQMKKQLGLLPMIREEAEYIFIGSQQMIDECMSLADSYGLSAGSIVGNDCTLPHGHHEHMDIINTGALTYVVYDTSSFSYENILNIMSENPHPKIKLGTYNNKSNTIITPNDVITDEKKF